MKINIIANQMRANRGEPLTLEMLQAELKEVKTLRPSTIWAKIAKQLHVNALNQMILYKQNRKP